jgi:two-component system OmpR family sensor kinase
MTERGIAPSGLVVAAVGFGLTRFTVTTAATDTTASFLFAGVIPLVLGLGLSATGVLLAVGGFDRPFVRTIAAWCLLGTTVMAVLVGLTVLGSEARPDEMVTVGEQSPFSTFLIGGAVGGALTGLYAARNRRYRRRLNAQTNRLVVLNRLLRDRVVNAATAISAHQEILERGYNGSSVAVIGDQAAHIVETVERVTYLAETDDERLGRVDLVESVESGLAAAREAHPDAEFVFDPPDAVAVRASDRLETAVRHLLENAVEYGDSDSPRVEVAVETTQTEAILRVSDGGSGLPESQQALLERGEIAEYDDPTTGFGLNVVRLLAERFGARLRTEVSDAGTTVELALSRCAGGHNDEGTTATTGTGVRSSRAGLAVGAGLVAGVTMAATIAALDGELLAIGGLYGIEQLVVALLTHEFHSVVFGLVYLSVLRLVPVTPVRALVYRVVTGVAVGLSLWLFAAGIVMPVWLGFVGIDVPLPNLTVASLAAHLVWGATVSLCYHVGDRLLDSAATSQPTGTAPRLGPNPRRCNSDDY